MLEEKADERGQRRDESTGRQRRPPAKNVGSAVKDMIRWRHYIGMDGPPDPMTRYVLLVIGTFLNVTTGYGFVSFRKIAEYANLSPRCVAKHVRLAIEEGFLLRDSRGRNGCNRYQAAFPDHDRVQPAISVAERMERFGPKV
jgi:hypothetical protein